MHVSKPTDHATLTVGPGVKHGAWMRMMCRCGFVVIHLSPLGGGKAGVGETEYVGAICSILPQT